MRSTEVASCAAALFSLGVVLSGAPAAAQQSEARAHFQRGVELFDEGHHDAALAEFDAAYEASPSYQVLFNIGQVHAQLGHAVQAATAYERYLEEGGQRIAAPRRAQVERELATQRARIGTLTVDVGIDGASISIDGSLVTRTPTTEPIRLSAGDHLVEVSAAGYQAQSRRIAIAGGVQETLTFSLMETGSARATIRVRSVLRDVEISIDGEVVGRTPLSSSLSVQPGLRDVRAVRAGYEPFRQTVEVGMGAEAEVAIELTVDSSATASLGQLLIETPPAASVYVDGALVDSSNALTLPAGDHGVRVELPDVVTSEERVEVVAESMTELAPTLRYTPAARAGRVAGVSGLRTLGGALMAVGGVLLAGGAGLTIASEIRRAELNFDDRRALLTVCRDNAGNPPDECFGPVIPVGASVTEYQSSIDRAQIQFNADAAEFNGLSAAGYTLIGVGAAALLASIIVLVTTPSDEEAATVQVALDPRGVRLSGTF